MCCGWGRVGLNTQKHEQPFVSDNRDRETSEQITLLNSRWTESCRDWWLAMMKCCHRSFLFWKFLYFNEANLGKCLFGAKCVVYRILESRYCYCPFDTGNVFSYKSLSLWWGKMEFVQNIFFAMSLMLHFYQMSYWCCIFVIFLLNKHQHFHFNIITIHSLYHVQYFIMHCTI